MASVETSVPIEGWHDVCMNVDFLLSHCMRKFKSALSLSDLVNSLWCQITPHFVRYMRFDLITLTTRCLALVPQVVHISSSSSFLI